MNSDALSASEPSEESTYLVPDPNKQQRQRRGEEIDLSEREKDMTLRELLERQAHIATQCTIDECFQDVTNFSNEKRFFLFESTARTCVITMKR